MTFKINDVATSLVTLLRQSGAWAVGDGEVPATIPADKPWGILMTLPGGTSSGGMAGNQEMASLMFQLKSVGGTPEQCRRFQQKMHEIIEAGWDSVTGCMGPPRVSPGGIVSNDQRAFEANDTIYMEVTGT
jgi:hypothetical protein